MPPKEKSMKLGDLATWALVGIALVGGIFAYGKLSQKVDDMDARLSHIETGLQQRGIIASTRTNDIAFGN